MCFTCGLTGHPSKSCPLAKAIPACPNGFCWRCKLPTFAVAGVEMHSGPIGRDCTNTALAESVKMMLLCGKANGVKFGPSSDSHFERLRWVTEGSPPNIVTLLARVARQDTKRIVATPSPVTLQQHISTPVHAIHSPVPITTEIAERIRRNRVAALQRLNASVKLVSTPSQATPARSTPSQSKTSTPLQVTPPTMQRPIALVAASAQQQHRSVTTPPLNPCTFFT